MNVERDVAVVGAGPIGSAAALAFARRGASVVVFEANPAASRRLAGEWLHPPGVEVLQRLGIDVAAEGAGATPGRGFVVFPDDRSAPIMLPYPDGMQGVSLEHESLVSLVRERATAGLQVAECVRHGWIKRVVSPQDKRRYELQITPKGERMLAEVRTIIAKHESEFLAPLSKDEREHLRELLAKLIS